MKNPRNPFRKIAAIVLLLALSSALPAAVQADPQEPNDPLDQTIDPNEAQGTGQVILDRGHIDLGPALTDTGWAVEIHDDTSTPAYWRRLTDVVLKVNDAAILKVPDNDVFSFIGVDPGTEVHVIPQTQNPDVAWVGWNTQEPNLIKSIKGGATLRILGVDGPGEMSVYLQSGNFSDPDVLWSTLKEFPQEMWIEVNAHTHANWVFTKPGVYLVELEFDGDLIDGSRLEARDTLRFSVGDETDAESVFAMTYQGTEITNTPTMEPEDVPAANTAAADLTNTVITVVLVAVGLGLVIAIVVVIRATKKAKARAAAARKKSDEDA